MIQGEHLEVAPDRPFVAGDQLRFITNFDRAGGETDREPAAGVTGRDGVEALAHRHPRPIVHPGFELSGGVERLARERHQMWCFGGERRLDGDRPTGDHPSVVEQVAGGEQLVERGQ